ncbi:hypothetical protein C1924_02170 [Stenotrophomonas sp. ESTM1D_MKCIP4_1]|nr:hypothetical protein C1924_02170 [Stenotrophomonas sp. ESTM1D_MKCIP4_1]
MAILMQGQGRMAWGCLMGWDAQRPCWNGRTERADIEQGEHKADVAQWHNGKEWHYENQAV